MTQTEVEVLRRVVTALGSAIVAASLPSSSLSLIADEIQDALKALKDLEPPQ